MPVSAPRAHILAFVFLTQALAAPTAVYLDASGGVSLTEYGSPPPPAVSAGGGSLTQPRAAQAPNGDTYMVVLDQWGSLWGNVFTATTRVWNGWRQSGGGLVGSPAVAVGANGTAWVVVRSTYGALWLTSLAPSGFGSWTNLGGVVGSDPAITITSTGGGVHYFPRRRG